MKLNDVLEIEPLSKALQRTLRPAHEHGASDLATWLQLEIGGYYSSNSAMSSSITVPPYRTVVGTHFNIYGQRLQPQPDLSFINETRLREGVEALESLRDSRQTVVIQDPTIVELIARYLKVEVSTFHFDSVALVQVLSQIRAELLTRGQVLATTRSKPAKIERTEEDDVILLSPNFYGLGINLRALWRKATGGKNSKATD